MHERDRIVRMLRGERTDLLPWATRLDIWHASRLHTKTLPTEMTCLDRMEIHRHLGIGRQCYSTLVATRLCGVELTVEFNGTIVRRESNPSLPFPKATEFVPKDKVGDTTVVFGTPVGKACLRYRMNEELIRGAAAPYLIEHVLKDQDDLRVVKWILDHSEVEASYGDFEASATLIGSDGFVIGTIDRIPFQRILLDFMGEARAVFAMADDPRGFHHLLDLLSEQGEEMLEIGLESPALMIEFVDNFDGMVTSPRLFQEYCLPYLQAAADKAHSRGRFLGSHMDGDLKSLLHLVPESGIDVIESFSPSPLTRLTFADAWNAWADKKLLVWGGIPSPIFEQHVPVKDFVGWVSHMLDIIGDDGRIILGIGDQAMGPTLIDRVRLVSDMLGR